MVQDLNFSVQKKNSFSPTPTYGKILDFKNANNLDLGNTAEHHTFGNRKNTTQAQMVR